MRRAAAVAVLLVAFIVALPHAAVAQGPVPPVVTTTLVSRSALTPLGWYALGSIGCAAASPIVGTIVLGREMTASEVGRSTLTCALGPAGWLLAARLFPQAVVVPARQPGAANELRLRRRGFHIPPAGDLRFVANEILLDIGPGVSAQALDAFARRHQLTLLETQSFALTGRSLQRWRIDSGRSVPNVLRRIARNAGIAIAAAQPNLLFQLAQGQPGATARDAGPAQYVVGKLRLLEIHRITSGDNVLVAIIDSAIDTMHPDLAGVVALQFDAIGTMAKPHAHGTGMAGAIGSHVRLVGVAPKVRILAVRAFDENSTGAQSTTFNVLKGLDWAAAQGARIVNMSFAGPPDPMFRDMLAKAHARNIVLIAAVGNAGPRSPPLYPGADPHVIGVTATDAEDRLLVQANRGPQVAVAAPGVDILLPAPDAGYQVTSGTSVAAAHVSGVAALLLARRPDLKPDAVRSILMTTAIPIGGQRRSNDFGAGMIDALKAVNSLKAN